MVDGVGRGLGLSGTGKLCHLQSLISASVRRPVAVAMLYGAVVLLAAAAWNDLAVEVEPRGDYPEVTVSAQWRGASPETLQALVTAPIEALAAAIPGVRNVRSDTRREQSEVRVEFAEGVDLDLALFELSDRLALLAEELPEGVSRPQVRPYVPRQFEELQGGIFYAFSLRSGRDLNALRALAKERVVEPLLAVEGVGGVDVSGGEDPYLRVSLDPERCKLYGIRPFEVLEAIQELDATWPVGTLEVVGTAYAVRVAHPLDDLEPLRSLPLGRQGQALVTLADVATVTPTYDTAETYTRVDGEPVVELRVHRKSGTDVLTVAQAVRDRVDRLRGELPPDITLEVIDDEAADMEAELALVGRRLVLVLVIVAALLFVLLRDLRTPLVLYGSIGAALALTVIALYHGGVPVNVLTLTGLALAFGMLVDNAVVVLENVARHREAGASPPDAARRGTSEVVVPILASTLTTIGVFFPFVFFQGRLRDYYWPLALAVAFSLAASLLVAVTLMPAVAGRGWVHSRPRLRGRSSRWYRRGLRSGLRHPLVVVAAVALAGYGAWTLFEEVPGGGFGGRWWSRDRLYVRVTLPSGAEAARTDATLRPFEAYVLGLDRVDRVSLRIMRERGFMEVYFPPDAEATAYPLIVKENLISIATRYAGIGISVSGFDQNSYFSGSGAYTSYGYGIKLLGFNYERLGEIGRDIARTVKRSARVQEAVVTSGSRYWGRQGSDVVLEIRRDRLGDHGLTVQDVAYQLRALLQGPMLGERLRVGAEEWAYRVKLDGADRRVLREVLEAEVPGTGAPREAGGRGEPAARPTSRPTAGLRFADLLDVRVEPIPGSITRQNQRYERWVRWEYRGSSRAGRNYEQAIFDSLQLPPGYSAVIDEPYFLTREERLQIRKVAAIALLIVFMVLASLYESVLQPLVVLLSVPCALIGVAVIFWATGRPFDASASVGVILLAGIVVNNAILMVDHINLRRREPPRPSHEAGDLNAAEESHRGTDDAIPERADSAAPALVEAIVTGAAERVRPILITSITTIGGLLPLVIVEAEEGVGTQQDIWSSLALATIGGLTAATLLTLTLTPVLYYLVERGRAIGRRLASRVGRVWHALPE